MGLIAQRFEVKTYAVLTDLTGLQYIRGIDGTQALHRVLGRNQNPKGTGTRFQITPASLSGGCKKGMENLYYRCGYLS